MKVQMNESTNVFLGFVNFDNIDYEGKGRDRWGEISAV